MKLVESTTPQGKPWLQLEGEHPGEWQALEDAAADGASTSGPGLEAEAALVALVARLGFVLRIVQGPLARLVVLTLLLLALGPRAVAFTMAAFEGKVVGVADGDTLTVLHSGTSFRVVGVIEGRDAAEVLKKGAEHAKTAHGMATIPPDVAKKVQAAIQDKKEANDRPALGVEFELGVPEPVGGRCVERETQPARRARAC